MKRALRRARRSLLPVLSIALALTAVGASASGSSGWDHLGDLGSPNGAVYALEDYGGLGTPAILIGGSFTSVGRDNNSPLGIWVLPIPTLPGGFRGFMWGGFAPLNGGVHAIASDAATKRVFAGGQFTNAGGNAGADFLAVWDGNNWAPFCSPAPAFGGSVSSLQIIGSTLYVGGAYQNGAGIPGANYLIACDLTTGVARVVGKPGDLNGGVYALTADANGMLYVGGQFSNVAGIPAADHVVAWDGAWHALGSGVPDYVRSLASSGNDVFIGTDSVDIAGIPQADHVARWNGSGWSALGANSAGTDGWLPKTAFIYAIAATSSQVVVTGSFQNADGNPLADSIASFDGAKWNALGSDGAGNGPWSGNGLAVAIVGKDIYAGGNFTSAGGDPQASYIAHYTAQAAPSNLFTIGAATPNLGTGTATLAVTTPGSGTLTLRGVGVRAAKVMTPTSTGPVKLTVQATGKARRVLDSVGQVKVNLTITFAPTGGTTRSRSTTVVLKKRR